MRTGWLQKQRFHYPQKDPMHMKPHIVVSKNEQRESQRFQFASPVMFENYLTGNYNDGRMINYSRGGMCFETDVAPDVGAELFIGIENSPYSSHHDVFRARVIWIKEQSLKDSYYAYGVGVKYC
jgi:hypothetical protein